MMLTEIDILRSAKILLKHKGWDGAEAACDRSIDRLTLEKDDQGVETWRRIKRALHTVRALEAKEPDQKID